MGEHVNGKSPILGKQSLKFENAPYILWHQCVAGAKEGEGPLGNKIDFVDEDPLFGADNWEEAESMMQKKMVERLLRKANLKSEEIRYLFAGDLLGQLIGTTFGIMDFEIPLFGLYGACSTMGESMALAAMTVNAGYANRVMALASSHFASAEKQFRYPLEYGNQRPLSATWTVTGCGGVILGSDTSDAPMRGGNLTGGNMMGSNTMHGEQKTRARITGITTGKIVDYGVKDSMNMGACMAPAAADLLEANFKDFGVDAGYYDRIFTGDLGLVGRTILLDLMKERGYDIEPQYQDCGIVIYDGERQDTHSGGSGCGCSAVVLCSHILPQIEMGYWKRVLFVPTGALLSTISFNEGQTVPGIAHGIVIEGE